MDFPPLVSGARGLFARTVVLYKDNRHFLQPRLGDGQIQAEKNVPASHSGRIAVKKCVLGIDDQ